MTLTPHLHVVLKFKNAWSYTSTLPYTLMMWCLIKHMDNFTVTFIKNEMYLNTFAR